MLLIFRIFLAKIFHKMNLVILICVLALVTCQLDDYAFQECPVIELNQICTEKCEATLLQCIFDCPDNDNTCVSQCIRQETDCINSCPCQNDCPNGCTDCDNQICQCEDKETNDDWNVCIDNNGSKLGRCIYACNNDDTCEDECVEQFKTRQFNCPCEDNCPAGCPCDDYPCTETTTAQVTSSTAPVTTTSPSINAVLVLSTYETVNKPMVIDWDGNFNDDLNFEYGEGTTVRYGCGATLMGQFWYFGGFPTANYRQVSKIVGCKLVRQNDMPFVFNMGSCNSFAEPTPKVLLCFDYSHTSECHTFDGENFEAVESSKFSHRRTLGMGNYKGRALTTGCNESSSCYVKTELMDMESLEWSSGPDYSFASQVQSYSTAATSDAAYIIGGYQDEWSSATIAEFRNNQWRKLGDLAKGRSEHGSISVGPRTMIVGGTIEYGDAETEVWELVDENNTVITPSLPRDNFAYGIALFPVNSNFCKK